jgi:hypothetical protein
MSIDQGQSICPGGALAPTTRATATTFPTTLGAARTQQSPPVCVRAHTLAHAPVAPSHMETYLLCAPSLLPATTPAGRSSRGCPSQPLRLPARCQRRVQPPARQPRPPRPLPALHQPGPLPPGHRTAPPRAGGGAGGRLLGRQRPRVPSARRRTAGPDGRRPRVAAAAAAAAGMGRRVRVCAPPRRTAAAAADAAHVSAAARRLGGRDSVAPAAAGWQDARASDGACRRVCGAGGEPEESG